VCRRFFERLIFLRAVVTRVSSASVTIDGAVTASIEKGFLVLVGIAPSDTPDHVRRLADKIIGLRIFEDENGKMNLNLASAGGSLLIVSQFTLYADTKSRRPGFTGAARPEMAIPLYELFIETCRSAGFHTETGRFGADMKVNSVNDGPVTILLDTDCM
jgi:D-tyrosyl-tRNA(Tyr) deacylase